MSELEYIISRILENQKANRTKDWSKKKKYSPKNVGQL